MANVMKLDALREKAAKDFGDFVIEYDEDTKITLLNPLRVTEEQRESISAYFEKLGGSTVEEDDLDTEVEDTEEEGQTFFDVIKSILRLVASDPDDGEFLIEAIGDDKPLLLVVFNQWSEGTQAGEA